jgi:predicted metal-dependent hydrolase
MKKSSEASPYAIELEGKHLPIIIRKRSNSRRMVIRYQPLQHALSLTLPRHATIRQGLRFVEEKRPWIARELKSRPMHVWFEDGAKLPVLGREYTVKHVGGRGLVRVEGDIILVPGEREFMARRLREWLIAEAREAITALAEAKANEAGKAVRKISLRDTVSHWGSCGRNGNLSFSWRLVFAPEEMLHYIVCHEVAHLVHMNHGRSFWKQVEAFYPDYKKAREWFRAHGHTLYGYG